MNWITNIRRGAHLGALVLTLAVFSPLPARAGINRWTDRGLDGFAIQSLAVDPSNPSRIYAATGIDGLFRTADGGKTWIGLTGIGGVVGKVAIDAQAPDTLYAISGKEWWNSRLFRTTDVGNTWTQADSRYPVYSVIVDPGKQGLVYAGQGGAVSASRDGGTTWSSSNIPYDCSDLCLAAITSLALDPASPSTIYAGVDADYDYPGPDQLFKSTDSASTWNVSDRGLETWSSVYALAVDPDDSTRVLAATSSGIFLSLDSGRNWSATSPSLIRALVFDPRNPSVVYAGSDREGVLRSPDGGLHWSPFNPGLSNLQVVSLVFDRTGRSLYAGTRSGVFSYPATERLDLFGDSNGATGFFSFDPLSGRVLFGSVDSSGRKVLSSPYGPYAGWTPIAGAGGRDGVTRVLWNNDDGSAALWLARPEGVQGSYLYPARPGWAALDVAAGADGSTHILWTSSDGVTLLQTINAFGDIASSLSFGPYTGWSATAIADGPDSLTRLLWNNSDGRAGLSLISSDGILTTARYGPVGGWTALDVAVGGDGLTRILRAHADGQMSLWITDDAGKIATYGPIYSAPTGLAARRVAAGQDGSSRVLFTDDLGGAVLWLLSPAGVFQDSFDLTSPTPSGGNSWNLTVQVIAATGPGICLYRPSVGEVFHTTFELRRSGNSVSFLFEDESAWESYTATVNGANFTATTPTVESGSGMCVHYRQMSSLSGSFSEDGNHLTATEVSLLTLDSGEVVTTTLRWSASRV